MIRLSRYKRSFAHAQAASVPGAGGRWFSDPELRRTLRELLSLAWPIAAAMGGETIMGLVDTKLVGGLGPEALGGVGVAMTIAFIGYMFVFGVMRGVKVCVAHAAGRGREYLAFRYAEAGIVLALVWGVVFWAATRDVEPLLRAIHIDPALLPSARVFLATYTLGAPASSIVSAMTHHRQALGDSRRPMVVGLAGNAINAWLGWSLIYGHSGLPALGVRGGALATAATEWVEALVLLALLVGDARRSPRDRARARAELGLGDAVREVASLGIPTGVQFGSEMLAFATFTALLGTLGVEQVAAHQVALSVIRTSFLPGAAVAEACSVLVGKALGGGSIAGADRVTRAALATAVAFMACCGLIFALGGGYIARAFTGDPVVAAVSRRLLGIAAAFQVLDASYMVLRGALRGARDVRVPAFIGVTVVWICVPSAALLLGRVAGWGAAGGWLGFVGETTLGTVLMTWRWRGGSWRRAYASPAAPGRSIATATAGASSLVPCDVVARD